MTNLDTTNHAPLKVGDKVSYTKQYAYGKTGQAETKVMLIHPCNGLGWSKILMTNGDTFHRIITNKK